jgi:hypothetical protein
MHTVQNAANSFRKNRDICNDYEFAEDAAAQTSTSSAKLLLLPVTSVLFLVYENVQPNLKTLLHLDRGLHPNISLRRTLLLELSI